MKNRIGNILWGLFFVFIGVGLAGEVLDLWSFEMFFDGWWTLLIIIPCFISIVQNGFATWPIIGFIIGILLLLAHYVSFEVDMWKLVFPTILILIGLRIIFHGQFTRRKPMKSSYQNSKPLEHIVIFSGEQIHVESEPYKGASLTAIFGGLDYDLRDAIIDQDVEINATAIFGGIDILCPPGVKVKVNNVPIFGGVDNKLKGYTNPDAPTIYLNSTCMFGGIDIK